MKSKKELFRLLGERFDNDEIQIGKYSISDETYGRKSMIYFWNIQRVWGKTREEFEDLLRSWGFNPNRRYAKGSDATEVQVSYFKGWHWDV